MLPGQVVLLLWIALRELPGLGAATDVLVIGPVVGVWLRPLPDLVVDGGDPRWVERELLFVAGVLLNAWRPPPPSVAASARARATA